MDVRKIRESMGLSRAEFAEKIEVTVSCVESWEYSRRNPSKQSKKLIEMLQMENEK